jgi:hypothetical protein
MKILLTLSILFFSSTSLHALESNKKSESNLKNRQPASINLVTICGINKKDVFTNKEEKFRFEISANQEDEFSDVVIETINGQKPKTISKDGAAALDKKYESIKLNLTDGCIGTALYNHYNSQSPMNPMEKLTLKCICR